LFFRISAYKRGGRYAASQTLEKSLAQDGDFGEQSELGVRTTREAVSATDGTSRQH